jgi:hypothetical protein
MDRGCERNSQESLGRCTARIFIIKTKRHSRRAACIIINLSSRPLWPAPCAPLRHPARSIVNCGHSLRARTTEREALAPFPLIYSRVPDALLLDAGHFLRPSINLPEKKYQDDVDDERAAFTAVKGLLWWLHYPAHTLFVCCVCCMRM